MRYRQFRELGFLCLSMNFDWSDGVWDVLFLGGRITATRLYSRPLSVAPTIWEVLSCQPTPQIDLFLCVWPLWTRNILKNTHKRVHHVLEIYLLAEKPSFGMFRIFFFIYIKNYLVEGPSICWVTLLMRQLGLVGGNIPKKMNEFSFLSYIWILKSISYRNNNICVEPEQ